MCIGIPIVRGVIVLAAVAATSLAPVRAERKLIGAMADGLSELHGETRLEIVGLSGALSLRLGSAGSIRFAARSIADKKELRNVALWSEDQTLTLTVPEGQSGTGILVEIAIPSDLTEVRLQAADSKVTTFDLGNRLEIVGQRLELDVSRQMADVRFSVEDTKGRLQWTKEDATIEGQGLDLELNSVRGLLRVKASNSKISVTNAGSLEADLDASTLVASDVKGPTNIEASGGSLDLRKLSKGAELQLAGTPLQLATVGGSLSVETDSAVQFSAVAGDLSVKSYEYGASVTGNGVTGKLEIEMNGAEVRLENLEGASQIRGDELSLQVKGSKGELSIRSSSSSLSLEQIEGPVSVENTFGDVTVHGAKARVQILSQSGEVRATDLTGSIDLRADGPGVEVSWAALAGTEDSHVENQAGDVRLHLPAGWSCRIDAAAPEGTIESSLEGLRVSEDGTTATATPQGGKLPLLTIRAAGDLYIDGPARAGRQ